MGKMKSSLNKTVEIAVQDGEHSVENEQLRAHGISDLADLTDGPEPETFCLEASGNASPLLGEGEKFERIQQDASPYHASMGPFRGRLVALEKLRLPPHRKERQDDPDFWFRYLFELSVPPEGTHPDTGESFSIGDVMAVHRSGGLKKLDLMRGEELIITPGRLIKRPPPKNPMQSYVIDRVKASE